MSLSNSLVPADERDQLVQAQPASDELLAAIGHELRTPLNVILGLSELLCEGLYGALDEQQWQAVAAIGSSGQRLQRLVDDLLDLARPRAGHHDVALAPDELRRRAAELLAARARARGVTTLFPPHDGPTDTVNAGR